jgi:hypothetical protein
MSRCTRQTSSAEVFQHEVRTAVLLPPVVHGDDVGVAERGDRPRLGPEATQEPLVLRERVAEDLDRDPAPQVDVVGDVDIGRRARADGSEQPVPASDHAADLVSQAGTDHPRQATGRVRWHCGTLMR